MYAIFITGTAGSGKSLLVSKLLQLYRDNKSFPITLNLDPGVINLPYEPDVDVRDYIDIQTLMEKYDLGPNGSLIMASDMIATRIEEIQSEVDSINPDYVVIDTPGQIELFAFRVSGPYFVANFQADAKVNLFLFDGTLVSSPINYVSMALLASSIKLRLRTSQVNVLTKRDLIIQKLKQILEWSSSEVLLESALSTEKDSESSLLSIDLMKGINKGGFMQSLFAVSSVTMHGMVNLSAALARILSRGEEVRD